MHLLRNLKQGFDKDTAYDNLVDFTESGLLKRKESGDHAWRIEYRGTEDSSEAEYLHFVCSHCGTAGRLPGLAMQPEHRKQWT